MRIAAGLFGAITVTVRLAVSTERTGAVITTLSVTTPAGRWPGWAAPDAALSTRLAMPLPPGCSSSATARTYSIVTTSPCFTCARFLISGPALKVTVSPFSARSVTMRVAWSMASTVARALSAPAAATAGWVWAWAAMPTVSATAAARRVIAIIVKSSRIGLFRARDDSGAAAARRSPIRDPIRCTTPPPP